MLAVNAEVIYNMRWNARKIQTLILYPILTSVSLFTDIQYKHTPSCRKYWNSFSSGTSNRINSLCNDYKKIRRIHHNELMRRGNFMFLEMI